MGRENPASGVGASHSTRTDKVRLLAVTETGLDKYRDEAVEEIDNAAGGTIEDTKWKEREKECWKEASSEKKQTTFAATLAAIVLTTMATIAISMVANRIELWLDKKLQRKMNKYTAVYEGVLPDIQFYKGRKDETGCPDLAYQCFRLSRYRKEKGKDILAFDLLVQVRKTPENEALKFRPLRLFVNEVAAQSGKKQSNVNIAVSLRADAVWSDMSGGHRAVDFYDIQLVSEEVDS